MGPDGLFESILPLQKIIDPVGRLQITWLCLTGLYQMPGCQISTLFIIDQDCITGKGFEVAVQYDDRDR